jgi:hypothetical protein
MLLEKMRDIFVVIVVGSRQSLAMWTEGDLVGGERAVRHDDRHARAARK